MVTLPRARESVCLFIGAAAMVAAALAGCTTQESIGAPSAIAKQSAKRGGGWLSARARTARGLVYVSETNGSYAGAVFIFDKAHIHQGPVGKITDGLDQPTGLAVDSLGALYVANYNNTVTVYPRGHTTASVTYTDGISDPIGLAVAPDTGRLYVANSGAFDVTEYPKGSTAPDKTVYFNIYEGNSPFGVALNGKDELYVSNLGFPNAQAYKLPMHQDWPKDLGINDIKVMHGIAVDEKNDVLIANQVTGAIEVFPPGSHKPTETIKTRKYVQAILIALDKAAWRLYVTDPPYNVGEIGKLLVFSYPQGEVLTEIHVDGAPTGVAVSR